MPPQLVAATVVSDGYGLVDPYGTATGGNGTAPNGSATNGTAPNGGTPNGSAANGTSPNANGAVHGPFGPSDDVISSGPDDDGSYEPPSANLSRNGAEVTLPA